MVHNAQQSVEVPYACEQACTAESAGCCKWHAAGQLLLSSLSVTHCRIACAEQICQAGKLLLTLYASILHRQLCWTCSMTNDSASVTAVPQSISANVVTVAGASCPVKPFPCSSFATCRCPLTSSSYCCPCRSAGSSCTCMCCEGCKAGQAWCCCTLAHAERGQA